jgi:hypothetical protein
MMGMGMGAGMGAGTAFDPLAAYGYGGYAAAQDPAVFAQAQAVLQQYGGYGAQTGMGMTGIPGADPSLMMGGYGVPGAGLVGGTGFGMMGYGQREMCADFARGRCDRGSTCKSEHGSKRETCGDFQNDRCTRGDTCKYLHEKATCGDFNRGLCTRGEACRFSHVPHGKPSCRDFERGTCTRGDLCRFAHRTSSGALATPVASTGVVTSAAVTGVTSQVKRPREEEESAAGAAEEDANKRPKTGSDAVAEAVAVADSSKAE